MIYLIVSELAGTPGEIFDAKTAAARGINVQALIEGGFIVPKSAPKLTESATIKPKTTKRK